MKINRTMVPMESLIESISMGPFGSDVKVEYMQPTGVPVIDGSNLTGIKMNENNLRFMSPERVNSLSKSLARAGDIIATHRGTLGQIVYVPDNLQYDEYLISQSQFRVTLKKDLVDPAYFAYYFHTSEGQKRLLSFANYVGVPALAQATTNFRALEFPLVPLEYQKKVVSILLSIDAKIENNNTICADLEGMAKLLYDYWFVQFDFPDEKGKPYKSSGGKMVWNEKLKREIPEGWSKGCVSDLGTVVTGSTPSTEHTEYFTTEGHAWATPKDLSLLDGRFFFHGATDLTDEGLKNSTGNMMPEGSILFTTRAPIGYIAVTANPACTNQGFKSVIPDPIYGTEFVFQTLKSLVPQMQRVGVGSTFKEVSKDVFSDQPVVLPPKQIVMTFAKKTKETQEMLKNIQRENTELASLRDFLLPMLMNGQVKVKEVV